jgi:hypothetical protein
MAREGFEPAIPAIKRPQTYALDRAATGIGGKEVTAKENGWKHLCMPPPPPQVWVDLYNGVRLIFVWLLLSYE